MTGYGIDTIPPGAEGLRNPDSQTDRPTRGLFCTNSSGRIQTWNFEYQVDTTKGNSGGPVIGEARGVAAAIHTDAGCDPPSPGNKGTGFRNSALMTAILQRVGKGRSSSIPGTRRSRKTVRSSGPLTPSPKPSRRRGRKLCGKPLCLRSRERR